MNAMAEFLPEAWRWVLEATLQACIIVAVIRVVQLALGKRLAPRWHYALWLLLLARMVMPWAPESSVSIFNLIEIFRAPAPQVESMSLLVTEVPVLLGMQELARPLVELPEPSLWATAWGLAKSVGPFPILWFSGMALVLAYVALRNFVLWRAFRRARPLTDEKALALLDACRSEMGIRRSVPVIVAGKMFSPALFGLVRPRLILPTGLTESISSEQLRFVFLHELSHLKRHDLPVNWLMTLVLAVHWMNPLLWYGYYRMRLDRELACDALALSYVQDEDPNEYGLAILELVERHCQPHRVPGMVGILENTSQLKRRISAIAVFKKNSYRWTLLAAAVLLTLGGAVLTDALATEEPEPEAKAETQEEETVAELLTAVSTSPPDVASQEVQGDEGGKAILPKGEINTKRLYDDTEKVSYPHSRKLSASEDPLRRFVDITFTETPLAEAVELLADMGEFDYVLPDNANVSVTAQFTHVPLAARGKSRIRPRRGY